jgi:hypothetical protein
MVSVPAGAFDAEQEADPDEIVAEHSPVEPVAKATDPPGAAPPPVTVAV